MRYKTAELEGALLDAAVAKANGDNWSWPSPYSSQWEQGGPIIERLGILLIPPGLDPHLSAGWTASVGAEEIKYEGYYLPSTSTCSGPTPLIAAMRAYVAAKLGEEVELP